MERKQIILPTKKFFEAPDQDLSVRVGLDKKENLLREGDKNILLNLSELYDQERNKSNNYRIYGKVKMIFRNMYSGNTSYQSLKDRLYLVGDGSDGDFTGFIPYDEFAFLRRDVLREVNTPNQSATLGSFTQNVSLSGYTGHTTITPITAPYQNWNVYLSYVNDSDPDYPMTYSLSGGTNYQYTAKDGIPFRVIEYSKYYKLTSPVEHGISEGEYIVLSGGTLNNLISLSGRTFEIESLGDETYNSEKYVINILKSVFPTGTTLGSVVLGKRCIDKNNISGTTSEYYVHKHKTLTDIDDYILDKIGFESPIWEDEKKIIFENSSGVNDVIVERNRMESVLFGFKNYFTLTGITNNHNHTPTEFYVTILFRNGNGFFDYPPKIGYKFNFHDDWIDQHFSGATSNETNLTSVPFTGNTNQVGYTGFTFYSGQTLPVGSTLVGAFVEYNVNELKERIISETFHKLTMSTNIFDFNQDDPAFYSGCSSGNTVGLYYQPHYRIKLRQESPYIETSDTNLVDGLPENTKFFSNENLWKWRDLYPHGYIDEDGFGTNYPFLNDTHNVKIDINFYLRNERQYKNKADGINPFGKIKLNDC